MKSLVIYTSKTGFTKRYAEWIADRLNADLIDLKEARNKCTDFFESYHVIAYGGWALAGNAVGAKWFLAKSVDWNHKRLAIFCVGSSPNDNPDIEEALHKMLTDEQRTRIKAFYCQGGLSYERMTMPYKLAMRWFVSSLKKKKDASEKERQMAAILSSSYDISDIKYIDPIVEYLEAGN